MSRQPALTGVGSGQMAERYVKRLDSAGERLYPVPPAHGANLFVRDEFAAVRRRHVCGEDSRVFRALLSAKREPRIAGENQLFNLVAGLLSQLADCRLPGRLAGINYPTGKLPLLAPPIEHHQQQPFIPPRNK